MDVQIFGVRKSADTRKALRFFSERRIRTHFVDLDERPIADSELQRFVQRFGIERLVDVDSKRFAELGLRASSMNSTLWVDRMLAEPLIMRLPLVRRLGQPPALTVGFSEDEWKKWSESARQH